MKANTFHPAKSFLKLAGLFLTTLAIAAGLNSSQASPAQTREVRVVNTTASTGQNVNVAVELVSQGNENALGFSLNFNPAIFSNPAVVLGSGAAGAMLNVNSAQVASGRLGVAMALSTGQTFAAGTRQIIVVTFAVAGNATAGATPISFGDIPIAREISDVTANTLTAAFTAGSVTVQQPNPVPALTSLSPASATAGSGNLALTVNGSNFVGASEVRWNNNPRTTAFVSGTQVTATIPASDLATAGTATVTVVSPTPGGGTSNSLTFTINNPAPTITNLNPNSATAGGAAFTLTVTGSGFVNGSTVQWNGSPRTTTFGSATQLMAAISATDIATAGTASVTVINSAPGGGTSNSASFTINQAQNPVPTITSLNPNSAVAGGAAFTLTLNGSNFINGSTVWWNGSFRTTNFVSATQLTAAIPATDIASAGTASVTVNNPAPGGGTSAAATFTINNPAPSVTSLNPNSATAGGAAFTLTVNGSGFVNGSTVQWNGNARTTAFVSATQLTATIPAADIVNNGSANVTVVNPGPGGGTSNSASFTISQPQNPVPTITALNPNSAVAGGAGFTLTINGTNFINDSTVWWNGSFRTTTFVSATQLTAAIPATDIASAGTASVTVNNATPGGGTSNAVTFTINQQQNPVPAITIISPNLAMAGGAAFTLTVNGTNFINGSTVQWNGSARATTFGSATQLTAAIPATDISTAGTASVTVSNPAPGGGTSATATFTVNNPVPTIAAIAPTTVVAGGNAFLLTLIGTNFVNDSKVQWNGSARTTTYVSSTTVVGQIPAADIATAGTASVTVANPAPGGGTSNAMTLTVGQMPTTQIALDPASPNSNNVITARLSGTWPDSCVPQSPQFTAIGNELRINTSNGGAGCLAVLTPWNLNVPIGQLAVGAYNLRVVHISLAGPVELGRLSFTVSAAVTSVSAASFLGSELAADSIVAAFGVAMATGVAIADSQPLPTTLLGTKISVKDSLGVERLAPLFFVAPTQINYLLPPGTATGLATVTVTSGDNKISMGTLPIAPVAPGLFTANATGQGVPAAVALRVVGTQQTFEPILTVQNGVATAIPIDLGPVGNDVYLIMYGTGIKGTIPGTIAVTLGGTPTTILGFAPAPGFVGLDQINVGPIPRSLIGRGEVDLVITVIGKPANTVRVNIK